MRRKRTKFILALSDYVIMMIALTVVVVVRFGSERLAERMAQHTTAFAGIFLIWLVVLYIFELYDLSKPFPHQKFLTAMVVNSGIAIAVFYLFRDILDISPRRNLFLIAGTVFLLMYGWRFLFLRLVDRSGVFQRVAIIGAGPQEIELMRMLVQERRTGFHIEAIVCAPQDVLPDWVSRAGITRMESIGELREYAAAHRMQTLIINEDRFGDLYRELYELIPLRLNFYKTTTFWEFFADSIPIYHANETWFLENLNRGPGKPYQILKRIADLTAVFLFGPVFLVLAVVTAVLVKITSPGPALFSQIRVGRNGQHYRLYKFRSMRTDAEKHGAQWAQENDPRITPIGSFIRATRLDEIPQVFNVLRGEMSFVGPRPERPEFVDQLVTTIPHYHLRHLVKPGLTGWAQVKYRYGASEEDAAIKLTYDLYYVKNISLVLDTKILLKTVMTIIGRHGR